MKSKLLIILLFISSTIYAQDSIVKKDTLFSNIQLISSIRSPRIAECKPDYLIGNSLDLKYNQTTFSYNIYIERQNNSEYKSLSFHIVEYPGNVREHINELFGDYI